MQINGINIKKYNAKQLKVEIQPPQLTIEKEWIDGEKIPQEFDSYVKFGTLKLELYFKGKDRNEIIRNMGEFLMLFKRAVNIKLDGYKGKYKGFMTGNSYNKIKSKQRFILELEFDGYLYDEEIEHEFTGVNSFSFYTQGTRETPCVIEITAQETIENLVISGFGNYDIQIEMLEKDKTIVIDGRDGTVMIGGVNAFQNTDIWEFPYLRTGETNISLSSKQTTIVIKYNPMLI